MEVFAFGTILLAYVVYASFDTDNNLTNTAECIKDDIKAIESVQADHEHRLEQMEKRAKANGIL